MREDMLNILEEQFSITMTVMQNSEKVAYRYPIGTSNLKNAHPTHRSNTIIQYNKSNTP